jgi:putative nucleotidyltransferase with HDIG domain
VVRNIVLPPDADEAADLRALVEAGAELSATLDSERLITRILQVCLELTRSEACSLILIGEGGNDLYFKGAIGARAHEVLQVRFPFDEHSVAGYSIKNRKSMRINDVDIDPRHNKDVDRAVNYRTRSLLAVPVLWQGEPLGVLEAVNKRDTQSFTETDQKYLELLAAQAAVALNNSVLVGRLQNFFHEAVELLIETLEIGDVISRSHLLEVARFATEMARYLKLSEPEMERLTYAAMLHDLGKIRVSDPEDPAHADAGGQILSRFRIFADIAPIVRHHHERYDGTGFPDGLKGEQIPRLARLLALAEAWVEELAQVGPEGRSQLMDSIRQRFRTWFDPDLRQAFEVATEVLRPGPSATGEGQPTGGALLTSPQQEPPEKQVD